MTITYHRGDATDPPVSGRYAIVHVLSTTGAYGAGFAKAVADRYPTAVRRFQNWAHGSDFSRRPFGLGQVQWVAVGRDLPTGAWWDRWVVHLVAQSGLRSARNPHPLDLDALHDCLESVAHEANSGPLIMPRIGCGLAGGSWAEVEPIVDATIGHLDVQVYDLGG